MLGDPFTLGLKMAQISMNLALFGFFFAEMTVEYPWVSLGIYGIVTYTKTCLKL